MSGQEGQSERHLPIVTGFGQTGPNKDLPVTDAVIQAFSGLMTVNKDSQGLPNRLNMIPIDVTTGLYAFQALSTALMRNFVMALVVISTTT